MGSAYPKKYTALATSTHALGDYHRDKQNPIKKAQTQLNSAKLRCDLLYGKENAQPYECINLQASYLGRKIKQEIRTLLEQEAEKTMKASGIPELTYLKPWSHYRRFEKGSVYFEHIVEVLTETLFDNWNVRDSAVRPALGHQGSQQTIEGIGQNGEKLTVKWAKDLFADSFIQEVDEITKRYYPNRQRYHLERMASVCSIIGLNFEQDLKLDLIVKKIKTSNTSTPLVKIRDYLRFEVLQKDYDEAGNQYNNWSLRGVRQGMLAMTHHVPDFNTEWKPYNPDENRWRIYVNTVRNGGKLK
ncbi:hypothetical protein [Actinobacillus equuli]|uniref:hypothetical protein n=1 Tax=Actinobacillus equuli TaxID=718 RepID=UPI00244231C0|nr:hypothetical protein [Actinobacillus equuli]WGE59641.1 hypothetical protein NYR73_02530 [Actinobacillus equuli subsp. haemolyticus]WGE61715.1 hypothetical protein NYR74_02940 [Actinobacillus equuli subsp. haemolyticus]